MPRIEQQLVRHRRRPVHRGQPAGVELEVVHRLGRDVRAVAEHVTRLMVWKKPNLFFGVACQVRPSVDVRLHDLRVGLLAEVGVEVPLRRIAGVLVVVEVREVGRVHLAPQDAKNQSVSFLIGPPAEPLTS
jgi:hypothetical protein